MLGGALGVGRKKAVFIADSLESAPLFQQVLSSLGIETLATSSAHLKDTLAMASDIDIMIDEVGSYGHRDLATLESMALEAHIPAMLLIVDGDDLADVRLPLRLRADFVVRGSSPEECAARIRLLLWPGSESSASEIITIGPMTLNLATYQVRIDGEPIDFTYLEYALLAFLVTHPGRTYSRDTLLKRVWGFEYYGGSRTVDVHVRRVRAKLGPDLANRLETVRGVGYLWTA